MLSSACVISVLIQALFRSEENKQIHKIRGDAHFLDCVPKVPDKVWEALVQSQVTYNSVPENIPEEVSQKVWKALVQSQVRFNRVPEKVWEALVQSQSGEGSEEGSGEGLGGFGAKPGQVHQGSGERSGEGSGRVWCRARSGSTGFQRRFREALVQSQVRFNRAPEKVPEKVLEKVQVRFNRIPEKVPEKVWQVQQDLRPFNSRKPS